MSSFVTPPVPPMRIAFDARMEPSGPVLTRRMSNLRGLFADTAAWEQAVADDTAVYEVASSPVPEAEGELPRHAEY